MTAAPKASRKSGRAAAAIAPEIDAGRVMDGVYRYQRHIYDLTRKFYLFGRDGLIDALDPPAGGAILEIGCGTGRNLIRAARRHPQARCYGLDISREMLTTARASLARSGVEARVALALGDAAAFDPTALFGRARFDRVFFAYSLSMIPDWRGALARGYAATAPGGQLHVVDFGMQEGAPRWCGRALRAWLARFHVSPRADLEDAASALASAAGGDAKATRLRADYARVVTLQRPQNG